MAKDKVSTELDLDCTHRDMNCFIINWEFRIFCRWNCETNKIKKKSRKDLQKLFMRAGDFTSRKSPFHLSALLAWLWDAVGASGKNVIPGLQGQAWVPTAQKRTFLASASSQRTMNQWLFLWMVIRAPQVVIVVKNSSASAGDLRNSGLIPGLKQSPGEGNVNPLQHSYLENPVDRGAWCVTCP